LAGLLAPGSNIICIDKDRQQIEPVYNGVSLRFERADIEKVKLPGLDGVLMANSLHYIKRQEEFVETLNVPSIIVVEYDTDIANRWVPYPVSFKRLQQLFGEVVKLGERPSVFGRANLYACQVTR
jgi:hypothetical protein